LVSEAEGTQIIVLFGGAISIQDTVSLVSEMENKHSRTLLW